MINRLSILCSTLRNRRTWTLSVDERFEGTGAASSVLAVRFRFAGTTAVSMPAIGSGFGVAAGEWWSSCGCGGPETPFIGGDAVMACAIVFGCWQARAAAVCMYYYFFLGGVGCYFLGGRWDADAVRWPQLSAKKAARRTMAGFHKWLLLLAVRSGGSSSEEGGSQKKKVACRDRRRRRWCNLPC
jgi:hypothetical protein